MPGREREVMTTSPLIERPRPATRGPGDQPGNQQASAARRIGRSPVPVDRAALAVLLVGTAALYLWGLGASGWANSFYSAAAQAGSESWKALFFGASDAADSITVDKTPLRLWSMALSVQGLRAVVVEHPGAPGAEGVAAVCAAVRDGPPYDGLRRRRPAGGRGARADARRGADVPVQQPRRAAGAAADRVGVRAPSAAIESTPGGARPRLRWLALAGALVGLAFLTKMLQAFLVLPALALVYLLFAAHTPGAGGSATCWSPSARWSWPAAGGWRSSSCGRRRSRPYIGGSQDNSHPRAHPRLQRLRPADRRRDRLGRRRRCGWGDDRAAADVQPEIGGQVAWLLPAALVLGVAGLWFARGDRRTDLAGPR